MKRIFITLILLALVSSAAAGTLEKKELAALQATCDKMSTAALENNHVQVVKLLYPEMVKHMGGEEQAIEILKQEEKKNKEAGVIVHEHSLSVRDQYYDGSKYRVVFVDSTMILEAGGMKMKSESYQVGFRELESNQWYLLDGTNLTISQFRVIFKGLTEALKLPDVIRTRI